MVKLPFNTRLGKIGGKNNLVNKIVLLNGIIVFDIILLIVEDVGRLLIVFSMEAILLIT